MTDAYTLEKWVWTERDFARMGWHDSRVYAIAFSPEKFEIAFDIDYIFQWIPPEDHETWFSFWVAPVTLVFENAYDVAFALRSYDGGLEIDGITRESMGAPKNAHSIEKHEEWLWTIACQEGEITFRSAGYKQYVRTKPAYSRQTLDFEARGISFQRGPTK